MLEQIPAAMRYGNSAPKKWEGTLEKLLLEIKDLSATFDYVESGRAVFYHLDVPAESGTRPILQFFSAATAKERWLEWWQTSGRAWSCNRQ